MTARAFKASKLLCCGSDNSSGYLSQVKHPKMLEEENGKYIKINKVFHQMRRVAVGRQVVKSFFFLFFLIPYLRLTAIFRVSCRNHTHQCSCN